MSRKFSKDEAQRIFSLAAERQQARQKEDVDQLTIADLEEAGIAAGIDPAFIRAAASDLLRPDRITEQRTFLGFPVEFRESHVLPLAFNVANWKKSVDIFTRVYNKPGWMREVGTTKRWSSEQNDNQMPANIIAEEDEDGTRFTIERKMWPMTLGFGIGAAVNLLIGLIFFSIWFSVDTAGDLIIPAIVMTGVGSILGIAGTLGLQVFSQQELKRFEKVFSYLEEMAPGETAQSEATAEEREAPVRHAEISLDGLSEKPTDANQSARSKERT